MTSSLVTGRSRTADHEAFRDSARRFVAGNVVPFLDDWRRNGAASRAVFSAAGAGGFLGTAVPEEFGGGDAEDLGFLAVLIEETVDAGAVGLALVWALHAGVVIPFVLEHGTSEDRHNHLADLVAGVQIGIPSPRGGAKGLAGGRLADVLLSGDGDGTALLPIRSSAARVMPTAVGLAAQEAGCADIVIDPSASDIKNSRPAFTETASRDIDLWLAVVAVATARRALGLALEYVSDRRVFGRLLAEFENTQLRLAEIAAELVCTTTHVDRCLAARTDRVLSATEAAAARHVAIGIAQRAADQSLQLHGGYGYMREYPIAQAFADVRFVSTAGLVFSDPRRAVAVELFSRR